MLLARSMVSLTDSRPSRSSSSGLEASGIASSRLVKLSKPPPAPFACAFLASALLSAMASLRLKDGPGEGGTSSAVLGLESVPGRPVDCVRIREGVLGAAIRLFVGVAGGFKVPEGFEGAREDWGIRDI